MNVRDLLREAVRALEANKGRSLLTILGIVIGIASVIAMTSLIGGVRNNLVSGLGLNAARLVYISAAGTMNQDTVDDLKAVMPAYEAIEGTAMSYAQKKANEKDISISITGASNQYYEMTGQLKLVEGRLFSQQEESADARVCIIERNGIKMLFGDPQASVVGRTVELNGRDYLIVGVSESQYPSEDNMQAFFPMGTVQNDFNQGDEYLSQVIGLVREGEDVDAVMSETTTKLATIMGYSEDEAQDMIYCYSMKSSIDSLNSFMMSFQLIMGAVAGISLLVGGIGIMNMMLTNVTERIREIGIRRALGATRKDITAQFLAESAALCVTGGIIGTIAGFAIAWALATVASSMDLTSSMGTSGTITPLIAPQTILLAVGLSVVIGLIFGYYPARRAAKLDPVECLRYQ